MDAYSKMGRTYVLYACSFTGRGQLERFLCKNALTLLAFFVILCICGFQLSLL